MYSHGLFYSELLWDQSAFSLLNYELNSCVEGDVPLECWLEISIDIPLMKLGLNTFGRNKSGNQKLSETTDKFTAHHFIISFFFFYPFDAIYPDTYSTAESHRIFFELRNMRAVSRPNSEYVSSVLAYIQQAIYKFFWNVHKPHAFNDITLFNCICHKIALSFMWHQ